MHGQAPSACPCKQPCTLTASCPAQDELKAEHYLWQLYHIDKDLARARSEVQSHQAALAEVAGAHRDAEAAVEERKRAQAGLQKERLQQDRALAKRRAELDKKVGLLLLAMPHLVAQAGSS